MIDPMAAIGIGAAALAGGTLLLTSGRRKVKESEAHGRARWALEKELRKAGMLVPESSPLKPGRWIVGPSPWGRGERVELTEQQLVAGLLIVGPTRAGKTSGNIAPNVARMTSGSLIVADPKSELWRDTAGFHRRAERLAPDDPEGSACFNPVPLCVDTEAAQLFATAIVEADGGARQERVWRDTSRDLLAGVLAHAAQTFAPTLATAYDLLRRPANELINILGASGAPPLARDAAAMLADADTKLRSSILVPTRGMLSWMSNPKVRRFTSASLEPPDFDRLKREPRAIYLCLEDTRMAAMKSFTSLFWTVVFYQLNKAEGGVPVCLVLDELANIGKIPDFWQLVTINPGRGIAVVACLQALSQLRAINGTENAATIFGNLRSKIVMSGLDYDTGELISKMCGSKTEVTPKESTTKRGFFGGETSKTESESEHSRRIIYPDDINAMRWEEQIVMPPYLRPVVTERYTFREGGASPAEVEALGAERTAYPMPAGAVEALPQKAGLVAPPVPDAPPRGQTK